MLTVLIVLLNIPLYYFDKKAGICVSLFAVCYFVTVLVIYIMNRSVIRKEVITFATQYGTVQKKLLDDFQIPYALLDYNSKILWMNEAFSNITEKDKGYHKSAPRQQILQIILAIITFTQIFPPPKVGYP